MFRTKRLLILFLLLSFVPSEAFAQKSVVGKIGIGVSGNFNFPVLGIRDRFRAAETWGLFLTYAQGPRTTVEVEYHRTRFDPGKLEDATFYWPEDKPETWQRVKSPLARNFMDVNAFTVNGLHHFVDREPAGPEGLQGMALGGFYITFGGGFYHYNNSVSGLIFAGQPDLGSGLDQTLVLEPFDDSDVAWGFNIGAGVEVLFNNRAGFDIRGRWHVMLGELRQMEAYGAARTFPLHYLDLGISMKYYLGR